ncbi:MAG: protein-L-isoaspartate(D-aspartate) O-methyltransferase, partial [Rhodospirillales bacterium]
MMPDSRKIRLILDLRKCGVTDARVLSAMERVPRETFTPKAFRDHAYENVALPIGYEQTLSQTVVVGQMTQALKLGPRMKVLEIGTGSGYQAAVLSMMCRRVYSVERHRPLLDGATERFRELDINNITTQCGDGTLGWPEQAPFERIIITAAAIDIPVSLVQQLAVGGLMVVPIEDGKQQQLVRVERTEEGAET